MLERTTLKSDIYIYIYIYTYIFYIYIYTYTYIFYIYVYTYTYIFYIYIYTYIHIHIVCSTLKHQFSTDILDENDTCISNAISVSSRKCSI